MATGLQGFTGMPEEQLLLRVTICTFKRIAMVSTIYPSIDLLKRIDMFIDYPLPLCVPRINEYGSDDQKVI